MSIKEVALGNRSCPRQAQLRDNVYYENYEMVFELRILLLQPKPLKPLKIKSVPISHSNHFLSHLQM
jgi:hypothetical protein